MTNEHEKNDQTERESAVVVARPAARIGTGTPSSVTLRACGDALREPRRAGQQPAAVVALAGRTAPSISRLVCPAKPSVMMPSRS